MKTKKVPPRLMVGSGGDVGQARENQTSDSAAISSPPLLTEPTTGAAQQPLPNSPHYSSSSSYAPSDSDKDRKMSTSKTKTKTKTTTKPAAACAEPATVDSPPLDSTGTLKSKSKFVLRKAFADPTMSNDDRINPPFVGHHFLDLTTGAEYEKRKEKLMVECQRLAALIFKTKFQRYQAKKPLGYESDGYAEDLELQRTETTITEGRNGECHG